MLCQHEKVFNNKWISDFNDGLRIVYNSPRLGLGVKKNGAERKLMSNGNYERNENHFCIFSKHFIFVFKISTNSN